MKNSRIAEIFRNIADILELKGGNPFRIRAYRKAAQNIEGLLEDVDILIQENRLRDIPGIGEDLSGKIEEIVRTGTLAWYEELKKDVPQGLLDMLKIPGVGPKTVKLIYENLKIDSIEELEDVVRRKKLRGLAGIREKTEENILKGIELLKRRKERVPLYSALNIARDFMERLRKVEGVEMIEVAGSVRRRKETIRDVDILVVSSRPEKVMDRFTKLDIVKDVIAHGDTKSSIVAFQDDIQVDLRVVDRDCFGAALMYFTGSKAFNIKLRQLALKKGYKINEYGVFSIPKGKKTEKKLAGRSEEEIFSFMQMQYIPAELREDRGEIELALKKKIPPLVELNSIKGDLHIHSKYSDGVNTIPEIVRKAKSLGYEYIAICDHSQGLKIAGGLSADDVYRKKEEIDKINSQERDIRVFLGTEVDIDSEGGLDYPDNILKEFDLVIAAIHSGFKQSKRQLTKRIIKACKNKYVHIVAHPYGRLFGVRDAYELDIEEVLKVCADYNVALEINCYPQRLDLDDINCMKAKKYKVKVSLGTDSHMVDHMDFIELGVSIARRGWLQHTDVINTMSVGEILKWLRKR